jgi:hypothetical protein
MKALMAENEGLKKENKIVTQRDSTVVVLGESKKYNEALVGQNEELAKTKSFKINCFEHDRFGLK